MTQHALTEEQRKVVHHPVGRHARVLAVAGSGKTTTMVHRINHLINEQGVSPESIFVVMFNRLARVQFEDKLTEIGLPVQKQPRVNTFHSCAFKIIKEASAKGLIPDFKNLWVGDKAEHERYAVHNAIDNLESRKVIPLNSIDPEQAMEDIALWKNSLIPPVRAGHRINTHIPLVYAEYEKLRIQQYALGFDDFIPMAVGILESEELIRNLWCNRSSIMIVDEYQDVNYGQQRLIELLAGNRADVMVVGDDDQTIYEWRGARPHYILQKFKQVFANKPHSLYQLPHSFRFGPVIAQCAQNVIDCNVNRIHKPVIANAMDRRADIHIFSAASWQQTDPHLDLANQVQSLVRETNDPSSIVVLGRTYSQMNELEAVFLGQKIPYRVEGRRPFFERREIQVLLDYVRLALRLEEQASRQTQKLLLNVANTPNRKLSRSALTKAMSSAHQRQESTRDALNFLSESPLTPLSKTQREQAESLNHCLERIHEKLENGYIPAGELLKWLVNMLDYLEHFDNYYGKGEHSEERKQAVLTFCSYASRTKLSVNSLLSLVSKIDTTQGAPEEHQIVMTSIFKTKGLEYDYVVIPNCIERYMPCSLISFNQTYDKSGLVTTPIESTSVDRERRLFYVALTRARKGVYIGTGSRVSENCNGNSPQSSSRFLNEMELEPTLKIMSAMQEYISGNQNAESDLMASIDRNNTLKSMLDNLLSHYLKSKKFKTLKQKIRNLTGCGSAEQKEEQKFRSFKELSVALKNRESLKECLEEQPWWVIKQ